MKQFENKDFKSQNVNLTKKQIDFIAQGSYGLVTRSGKNIYRDLKVISQDLKTGNVLIKEIYSGEYSYEKDFILSPEGHMEKLKLQTNPIKI